MVKYPAMLGRLRPERTDLTHQELSDYKAGYCGLCQSLYQESGRFSTLTLSYDLTFLAHLETTYTGQAWTTQATRCTALPWKRVDSFNVPAKIAALGLVLAHLKLQDDRRDEWSLKARLGLHVLQPRMAQALETLEAARFPLSAFQRFNQEQLQVEQGPGCEVPLHAAAAPSGRFTQDVFCWLSQSWPILPAEATKWSDFGRLLGEAVYIVDALEDRTHDARRGNFNPLSRLSKEELDSLQPELKTRARALLEVWRAFPARGDVWPALTSSVEQLSLRLTPRQQPETSTDNRLRRMRNRQGQAAFCLRDEYLCVEAIFDAISGLCWYAGASRREREMERVHGDLLKDPHGKRDPVELEPAPAFVSGEFACPNCEAQPMGCHVIGEAGLFHCSKCSGVWLNRAHLSELRKHPETQDFVAFPQAGIPPVHAQGARTCPVDGQKLELARFQGVTVDACPDCRGGIWMPENSEAYSNEQLVYHRRPGFVI